MHRVLVLIGAGVLVAGCSYVDFERPVARNYLNDLAEMWSDPERPPPQAGKEVPSSAALGVAFARWRQSVGTDRAEYRIDAGDVVKVTVLVRPRNVEDFGLALAVSPDGISLPLLGKVQVAGLSASQAAEKLTKLYGKEYYRDPVVIVAVSEFGSKRVVVTGAVVKPGTITLRTNETTLIEALLFAGGLKEPAGDKVLISRAVAGASDTPQLQTITVNLERLVKSFDMVENVAILPGDAVHVVPARMKAFSVLGFVSRPGCYELTDDGSVGVLDAIARAGGLTSPARSEKTYLMRKTPQGRKRYPVDLPAIVAGKTHDIPIQSGDVIIVRTSSPVRLLGGLLQAVGLKGFMPGP